MKRLVLLLLISMLFLASCGNLSAGQQTASAGTQGQHQASAQEATGTFQEFALPQQQSGLMRPAIDAQGHIWFGEMSRNYLGSFDPHTRSFWQGRPPNGKSGIMGIAVTPDNTIWFAEQYADYIGHFMPQSGQYRIYPLPTLTVPDPANPGHTLSLPSAPNDIVLDQHGTLWFTELNANALAALNTKTGALRQYPLTHEKNARALNPYGITVDPRGLVWFSVASMNRLGRLDPASGQISYFTPPGISSPLMEVASDAHGHIWATLFATGQLLQFDPGSARFTAYNPSNTSNSSGSSYGLLIASNGDIWITLTSENKLARFDMQRQRFFTYTIPTPNSLPIGLVEDTHHAIWFTESGSDKIGVLRP
jgi:streptogramin lyase